VPLFDPSEQRQLRLFGWFLLLINACIIGSGLALGRTLDDLGSGVAAVAALIVLVDGAFALIVGVNVAVVLVRRWRRRRQGINAEGPFGPQ